MVLLRVIGTMLHFVLKAIATVIPATSPNRLHNTHMDPKNTPITVTSPPTNVIAVPINVSIACNTIAIAFNTT